MTYTVTLEGALAIVFPDPSMKDISKCPQTKIPKKI